MEDAREPLEGTDEWAADEEARLPLWVWQNILTDGMTQLDTKEAV